MKNEKGFTLIELIVVIAIIGILAAVAVPAFLNVVQEAHQANMDAVAGVMNSAVVLAASEILLTSGAWALPAAADATFGNFTTQLSGDWTDTGGGVWTYGPTGGTVTYTPNVDQTDCTTADPGSFCVVTVYEAP